MDARLILTQRRDTAQHDFEQMQQQYDALEMQRNRLNDQLQQMRRNLDICNGAIQAFNIALGDFPPLETP